jgi:hypothetical protein
MGNGKWKLENMGMGREREALRELEIGNCNN